MMAPIAPVRRQIVIPLGPVESFDIFTEEIGSWWPLDDERSVNGPGGTVGFQDGRLVETSSSGTTSVWADVLDWTRGELLRLSWFPGGTSAQATEVRLVFSPVDTAEGKTATLVTLEHYGWERLSDPPGARAEYEGGWPAVMEQFGAAAVRPDESDELMWLVLRHRAGPAAPSHGPIFAHPDFAEHAAFLGRLHADGVLVAAGPLTIGEQPGAHGMTVIKVPAGEVEKYLELASTDDQSVVRGLLEVEPTTWNVVMHA